jgi:hypothetical protein
MFNILSNPGNAYQNDIEFPFHLSQKVYHQENKQQMLVRMPEEKEPLYTVGGNVHW